MSKISTITDALVTFLTAQLGATIVEHVNPYFLELNDEYSLADGFSFYFGPAQNTAEMASCMLSIERELVINISQKNYASKEDVSLRRNVEKSLFEKQYGIVKAMENDPALDGIELITFSSDNGIELIQGEETSFLALRSSFMIKYFEQL